MRTACNSRVIAAASPWGDYNDYTIAALRAHRERLRGTAILKPTVDRLALEAMAQGRHGRRAAAVHQHEAIAGHHHVRVPRASCAASPISTGTSTCTSRARTCRSSFRASKPAGVKLVIDHLGRPEPKHRHQQRGLQGDAALDREGPHLGKSVRRLPARTRRPRTTRANWCAVAGPERLMWASDCPFVGHESQFSYQSTIDWLTDCVPDASRTDARFSARLR